MGKGRTGEILESRKMSNRRGRESGAGGVPQKGEADHEGKLPEPEGHGVAAEINVGPTDLEDGSF
jgi:hypothetical protein